MKLKQRPGIVVVVMVLSLLILVSSFYPVFASTIYRSSPSTTQTFFLRSSSPTIFHSGRTTYRFIPNPQPKPEPTPEPPPPPVVPPSGILTADEQRMVDLMNNERIRQGLNPLLVDNQVVEVARLKSQDMITNRYFSHQSPIYGSPFEMLRTFGVSFVAAGENIAGNPTVNGAHTAFMNSTGHRNNILNSRWTHVGVGVVTGGPYGKMHTQIFIRR